MTLKLVFDPEGIIGGVGIDEILKLHKQKKLMDFLPLICENMTNEMKILQSWQKHFNDRGIPWATNRVVRSGRKTLSLWKEEIETIPGRKGAYYMG